MEAPSTDPPQQQYDGPFRDAVYSPPPLLRAEKLIGDSEALYDLVNAIVAAAQTDQHVLIHGETGTGKTLAARTIHAQSARSEHWLIVINCEMIQPDELTSVLLGPSGHSSEGVFDAAASGTVVFDHVDHLAPEAQSELNHILETHSFDLPFEPGPSSFNIRLLFLTSARLPNDTFSEELYYRLNQFLLRLPPLRARGDDVVLLARHFLQHGRRPADSTEDYSLSKGAQEALREHHWPGNVRELRNAMTRAAIVSTGTMIEAEDLPTTVRAREKMSSAQTSSSSASSTAEATSDPASSFVEKTDDTIPAIEEVKREAVKHAYDLCDGDIDRAAVELDIARSTMYRLLKRYDLK